MKDKKFDIEIIPEIQMSFENQIDEDLRDICDNYVFLIKNTIKILEISLTENIIKPLTIYNVFFAAELFLKLYLVKNSMLEINKIDEYKHDILGLAKCAQEIDVKVKELTDLLFKFKDKNNNELKMKFYYDFKYNRKLNSQELIFGFDLDDDDKKYVKEVMRWINYRISTSLKNIKLKIR